MSYTTTPRLGLRQPVKGSGEQFDSDIYSADLLAIDTAIATIQDFLASFDPTVSSADITDATSIGRSILTAANATAALNALGGTTVGKALFVAANADGALTTLGATTVGKALLLSTDVTAARNAMRLYFRTTPGAPQAGDVRTRDL